MKAIRIIIFFVLMSLFFACQEEKLDYNNSVIKEANSDGIGIREVSALDKYLKKEFLDPYNIEVKYRLDDVENIRTQVVPADEEKAIQMIKLIKYLCLDTYKEEVGEEFVRKYFPKTLVLIGSASYELNGEKTLGMAEEGVKIKLLDINNLDVDLDESNKEWKTKALIDRYFNTIFHEFSHILHQKKKFSTSFEQISGTDYVGGEWTTAWDTERWGKINKWAKNPSYKKGFISDYSSMNKYEDFVEIIAHKITLSDEEFDKTISPKVTPANEDDNPAGRERMNKKLAIIKSYLKSKWNIDLDKVHKNVQAKLENLDKFDMNNLNE